VGLNKFKIFNAPYRQLALGSDAEKAQAAALLKAEEARLRGGINLPAAPAPAAPAATSAAPAATSAAPAATSAAPAATVRPRLKFDSAGNLIQ